MKQETSVYSGRKTFLLIAFIALSVLIAMVYSYYSSERMINKYTPLIDAAMEVKLEATTAHLWFEEILSGDRYEKIEDIIAHIDQSVWYAKAMLDGGKNLEGTFLPLSDPLLREEVLLVIEDLKLFKEMTHKRDKAREISGSGTEIDQQYDKLFYSFMLQTDHVETLLQQKIRDENRIYQVVQAVLMIIVIVLTGLFFLLQLKYERSRQNSLAEITREKQQTEKSENLLQRTQHLAKVGGWEYDVARKEGYWTEEVYRIYEITAESKTRNVFDQAISFYAPQDQEIIANAFQLAVAEGIPYDLELRFVSNSGEEKWVHTTAQVERVAGKTVRVFGNIMDITERKMLQAQAIRTAQLASVGELAAGVAHEINNPINGVINYAQILLNNPDDIDRNKDLLGRIIKEGDRVASIVRGLLSFARDDSDKWCNHAICDSISETLSLIRKQLIKEGIILKVNLADNLPMVNSTPQQLVQLFMNLISNARYALNEKYPEMNSNKILDISAELVSADNAQFVRVTFHDKGIGIPENILSKVMDPFMTTKPVGIGTGLGLSISCDIVNKHGGEIDIESEDGSYTKVVITFPAVAIQSKLEDQAS